MSPPKRIAAIVLPALACEVARTQGSIQHPQQPFGLIVDENAQQRRAITGQECLAAVNARAYNYGIRPGQCVSEAGAFIGNLQIARLKRSELSAKLGLIAEAALHYGTTAALTLEQPRRRKRTPSTSKPSATMGYPLGAGAGPLDTVWLDISGCAHLHGGEEALCIELSERIGELGHRARIAVAEGPRIAQAVARWHASQAANALLVPNSQGAHWLAKLPTAALPLSMKQLTWFSKLGVLRISDLTRLDRPRLAHRLGPCAQDILQLLAGHDLVPLCPYTPPRNISEHAYFDDPIHSNVPLFFVLRGLIARAIARLEVRGLACQAASVWLRYDPAVVALHNRTSNSIMARKHPAPNNTMRPHGAAQRGAAQRGAAQRGAAQRGAAQRGAAQRGAARRTGQTTSHMPSTHTLRVSMPVPLCREGDLGRALHAKLERLTLTAPVIEVQLNLERLTERPGHQVGLGQRGEPEPTALPTLLAELSAWVDPHNVGTLTQRDAHRPEARSQLIPIDSHSDIDSRRHIDKHSPAASSPSLSLVHSWRLPEPTRILPRPIKVGALRSGGNPYLQRQPLLH